MQYCIAAAIGIDLVNRANIVTSSEVGRAVARGVAALDDGAIGVFSVTGDSCETAQHHEAGAVGVKFEDGACIVGSSKKGRAVQPAIPALRHCCVRVGAVSIASAEMAKHAVVAAVRTQPVNRAEVVATPKIGGAVKGAIAGLHETGLRIHAIDGRAAKIVQHAVTRAVLVYFINRAGVVGAADGSCAIQRAVSALEQGQGAASIAWSDAEDVEISRGATVRV